MHLKLLQKESFKKQQRHFLIWLVIKLLTELQMPQKGWPQNNSETITNEHGKEIRKER